MQLAPVLCRAVWVKGQDFPADKECDRYFAAPPTKSRFSCRVNLKLALLRRPKFIKSVLSSICTVAGMTGREVGLKIEKKLNFP